jgi:hypothetical protein
LAFNGVKVGKSDILATGAEAERMLDQLRHPLQCALAAELVGVAQELFDRTLDYLRTRRAFGRSLGAFQALQHRAVDVWGDIEISRALVLEAARVSAQGRPGTLELIAAARAKAGDTALRTGKWAVQMHGAMGFTDECDIGLYLKRAMALSRVYRAPEAHRERFAAASWAQGAPNLFELFRADSADDTKFPTSSTRPCRRICSICRRGRSPRTPTGGIASSPNAAGSRPPGPRSTAAWKPPPRNASFSSRKWR